MKANNLNNSNSKNARMVSVNKRANFHKSLLLEGNEAIIKKPSL
jgi:hypothetical protein